MSFSLMCLVSGHIGISERILIKLCGFEQCLAVFDPVLTGYQFNLAAPFSTPVTCEFKIDACSDIYINPNEQHC